MEVRLIERYADLEGRRVLEIGAGEGRLTSEIARRAASLLAIEPQTERVASARRMLAAQRIRNVTFRVGSAERLPRPRRPFDLAIFSWSL
jgi:ubiquinone/menaquinone biosynthesis C-methylase UbiE